MRTYIILSIAMAMSIFAACKKDTPATPTQALFKGKNIPKPSLGNNNDFYIDTASNILWGPKTEGAWGNGLAIKGQSIIFGEGTPNNSIGATGDYFLDKKNSNLYGPFNGIWSLRSSLEGQFGTSTPCIYSIWEPASSTVVDTTIDGTCVRVRHMYYKAATENIRNKGVLMTYFKIGSIGVYALPYISDAGGATNQINCIYGNQKITFFRHTFNTCRFNSGVAAAFVGQPVMINLPSSLEYRFIFIPNVDLLTPGIPVLGGNTGTASTSKMVQLSGMDAPVDLSKLSYEEVCALLHINK